MSITADELQRYYDASYPPSVYAPKVPATGATAGSPGVWTPPGSQAPATVADLIAGVPNVVIASPLTAWTSGQFVQTRQGMGGQAHWDGTAWVAGIVTATLADALAQASDTPPEEPTAPEEPEPAPTEPEPEPTPTEGDALL